VLLVYVLLPGASSETQPDDPPESGAEVRPDKLDIMRVSPPQATPGAALEIFYVGPSSPAKVNAFAGKRPLELLASKPGSVVVRLPGDKQPRRVKVRIARGDERSKPFDVQVEAVGWQKPFRNLVGGIALLILGIAAFSRGAREAIGVDAAARLSALARRSPAALGLGAVAGALLQSTTAMAGLLAGLVGSSLLAVVPAAAAFLGAGVGATAVPLLTGIIAPREGLLVVAVGVLVRALAPDRRFDAVGRLLLGAGFVAFGLFLLRQGFEPFVSSPVLLPLVDHLRADSAAGTALAALFGALVVAALQGPAPVIVLVLGFAQTTGHWDLRTAMAVLSGSAFGSALGSMFTLPASRAGRRLVQLNLMFGFLSTVLAAATAGFWSGVADRLVTGAPHEVSWGKRVLLPNLGPHLGVALALSELAVAFALLPLIPVVARVLERRATRTSSQGLPRVGDVISFVTRGLTAALRSMTRGLGSLERLALEGRREAGRAAEHEIRDARTALEELLASALPRLPASPEGAELSGAAFACRQLARSLDQALRQAERLVEQRIAAVAATASPLELAAVDQQVVREMIALLAESIGAATEALESRATPSIDAARDREIRLNGLEARARRVLLVSARESAVAVERFGLVELSDALESAGNHVYRLLEALSTAEGTARSSAPPPREAREA
jgi:Na+/phosphate symporter